jgi:hypothetical protein
MMSPRRISRDSRRAPVAGALALISTALLRALPAPPPRRRGCRNIPAYGPAGIPEVYPARTGLKRIDSGSIIRHVPGVPCAVRTGPDRRREAMSSGACEHIAAVTDVKTAARRECEECVKIGARWVHLRTCQECGATLCCDSSPNRHASKHARASGHPVIASAEPGERWLYCYVDDAFAEY